MMSKTEALGKVDMLKYRLVVNNQMARVLMIISKAVSILARGWNS